jgi:exopolysaccharide biosynthesis protein
MTSPGTRPSTNGRGGQNNGIPSAAGATGELVAGRTAVGLSADRKTLFLLTIDGVEKATPQYGAIFYDVGEWLRLVGASDGITLDGGGSTAMAMLNRNDEPVLVNNPHGTEGFPYIQRANAQFFGVVPGSTIV